MSRRGRAIGFAALAVGCAVASASIASAYRTSVDDRLGELRPVVTVERSIDAGTDLRGRILRTALGVRSVPERFLPPDAISDPQQVVGRRTLAAIPAGSYLLASHLRSAEPRRPSQPRLGKDLHPVEVTVSGAGALAATGSAEARVDVVVAGEPVTGGRARVRVAARGVRLIGIEPADPSAGTAVGGDSWSATLALTRSQALELIEAENFAREIRLIPAS
jgi:Flp pilus assembly protein CpaB